MTTINRAAMGKTIRSQRHSLQIIGIGKPMKTLFIATALILSMTAAANAAEAPTGSTLLGAGPLYVSQQNGNLFCMFINEGAASITPTAQEIWKLYSTTPVPSQGNCANGSAVAPNQTCYIQPQDYLTYNYLYSCKVSFSTAAAKVRGVLQIYDNSYNVLGTAELR